MTQALPKDVPQTLRRWKRYPDYKSLGVEWLGKVPMHWEALQLKRRWRVIDCKHRTAEYVDDGIPIVSTTEVKPGRLNLENTRMTSEAEFLDLTEGRLPKRGDIIYSRNASVGSAAYVDTEKPFAMGQDVCLITSTDQNQLFLSYLLNSPVVLGQLEALMVGSTINRINVGQIQRFWVVCPPLEEQYAIASFLDREIAKIDALIAKKERLIELLQEKRTAIISHTVTKGLDSTAPLKDSGVEWLGEIPEDWRVVTVRNLIRSECLEIQDGNHGEIHPRAEDYVEMGIPFLMANNIRNGKIDLEGCKYISEQQAKSLRIGFSQSGDVLLTHKGTLGETSIIPHNIKFQFVMLTPQVTYYRIKKQEIDKKFLYYYFQSKPFQERLKFIAGNQSTRDYVGLIAQKNFEIVLPYPYEQKVLASYLDRETAKIDALIAKIREGIEKLKEYRTALISATVTGKIDVRNEVAS